MSVQDIKPDMSAVVQRLEPLEKDANVPADYCGKSQLNPHYLEAILNNTNMPVFLKDADYKYVYINSQFEALSGMTNSEVKGKDDFAVFTEPVAQLFRSQDEEVVTCRKLIEFEETIPLPDGVHTFITAKFPLFINDNSVDAICGICTDITRHKLVEAHLREAEEKYRGIFEHSPLGILLINKEGLITTSNEKLAEILGSSVERLIGFNLLKATNDKRVRAVARSVLSGQITRYEGRYRSTTGGENVYLRGVFSPIYTHDGSINAAIGIVENITRQKETETALKKAHDKLEQRVAERTAQLDQQTKRLRETNVALKILLEKREEDKKILEETILLKVEKLIAPYLEKLKMRHGGDADKMLLESIESNLNEITLSFTNRQKKYLSALTPMQIQIADLIKHGHTTKEIADLLNLSPSTIACHRQEIRKRLSLNNKKINLQAALLENT